METQLLHMAEGEAGEAVEEAGHSIMAKEVLPLDVVYLIRQGVQAACLICHLRRWIWNIWLQ